MRVLILSCNTGEGHNSCAKAIKEVFDTHNVPCDIEDVLRFVSPSFSKFIAWGHSTMYRYIPTLFRHGYAYFENHSENFEEGAGIHRILAKASEPLYHFIKDNQYDTVLCVHVFSSLIMTDVQNKYPLSIASAFVATDYTCSPSVQNSNLDYYFIPDETLCRDFVCETIPQSKMICSGIPIRQVFYEEHDKADAKKQMGIDASKPHILMMCGSMGCGPMKRLVRLLKDEDNIQMTVVCGTNKRLYRQLSTLCADKKHIQIRGYEKNMPLLMDSADLYLTKPGGLSTTEAYVKNLPMVCIDAVAGCEDYNRKYYVEKGAAKSGKTAKELRGICKHLLTNQGEITEMQTNLSNIPKTNAAETIYRSMAELQK